jgi:multidrug resistance efflux pump
VSAQELALLEQLALLAAPVLRLMSLNERRWYQRAWDTTSAANDALHDSSRKTLRYGSAAAAVALAAALLVPADTRVGGTARLEGAVQRVLVAPADGFLGQVYVRPGELVRAGQLLAELAEQDLQVERARWESQLAQHENAYIAAHTTANRAQLVINQSRAAEAEAQLQLVDAKLGRARLLAPFDGVVIQGDLSQQLGAPVTQGTELMTVAPSLRFRVIVEVDERDIGLLRLGQEGTLALSALPWDTHAIKVVRITPMATVVNGHNVYEVEAALSQATPDLRPGLQGSAHIVTGSAPMLANWSRRLRESLRRAAWEVTG